MIRMTSTVMRLPSPPSPATVIAMPTLRRTVLSDAEAGARLQRACWREAYASIVDVNRLAERLGQTPESVHAEVEDGDSLAAWTARWAAHIATPGDTVRLVAEEAGELVGFAISGPARDEDVAGEELYALYVRRAWWGSGLGARLLDAVLADRPATLWVLSDNARAVAFYRRQGFEHDKDGWYDDLAAAEVRLRRGPAGS